MSTAEPPDEPGPPVWPPTPDPAPPDTDTGDTTAAETTTADTTPPDTPPPDTASVDATTAEAATGGPPPAGPTQPTPTAETPVAAGAAATWSAATGTAPVVPPPAATATPPPPPADTLVPTAEAWSAPPPKAKRRLTWLWILIAALGLIAALVVVAVVLFVRTLAGPIDATNKVLAQIKAGQSATVEEQAQAHYAKAYRRSCARDREVYTLQQYRQVFETTKAARGALTSYDVNYSSVHGDRADVRYDLGFGHGGDERYQAVARKESGTWRVCLLTSGGRS